MLEDTAKRWGMQTAPPRPVTQEDVNEKILIALEEVSKRFERQDNRILILEEQVRHDRELRRIEADFRGQS